MKMFQLERIFLGFLNLFINVQRREEKRNETRGKSQSLRWVSVGWKQTDTPPLTQSVRPLLASLQLTSVQSVHWLFGANKQPSLSNLYKWSFLSEHTSKCPENVFSQSASLMGSFMNAFLSAKVWAALVYIYGRFLCLSVFFCTGLKWAGLSWKKVILRVSMHQSEFSKNLNPILMTFGGLLGHIHTVWLFCYF